MLPVCNDRSRLINSDRLRRGLTAFGAYESYVRATVLRVAEYYGS